MIKILHIVGLAHGGAGQHILSLAAGCDPRRFESTVAMADNSQMRPQFERAGVRVLPLSMDHFGGLRKNIRAYRQIVKILRSEHFDLVQTHTSVAGALGRVAARTHTKAPVVHMLHAFASHAHRSRLTRRVGLVIERRLDRWTDWYIAGTRAMVQRGVSQRIFKADKVVLINNGIDLARFSSPAGDDTSLDDTVSINGHAGVTVGFLGRLEKQKGVVHLIRAAAIVRKQNRNVRFLIAGEGALRGQLERLTSQLAVADTVEFVGWKHDIARFLKQIDIMAMPSLWEAFGLSAAEAMALERPVIASAIEGLPEVVDGGRTGLLVPPADPDALARAILELAADPARRRTMGQLGRARVEELFTVDRMITQHEAFYERVVGGEQVGRVPTDAASAPATDAELSAAN